LNEAYKLASKITRHVVTLTTLQKPDGLKTADIIETMKFMIEQLIPEYNVQDDTNHHMSIRRLKINLSRPLMTESSPRTKSGRL